MPTVKQSSKMYLGDGVYAEHDERCAQIILTTENGISVTNRIVLDSIVYGALVSFVERLQESRR
jgi:hypothetical protein